MHIGTVVEFLLIPVIFPLSIIGHCGTGDEEGFTGVIFQGFLKSPQGSADMTRWSSKTSVLHGFFSHADHYVVGYGQLKYFTICNTRHLVQC